MDGQATPEARDAAMAALVALCEERGLRWRWRTRPRDNRWDAEVKVEHLGDFGWATLAWFSSTGRGDELSVLQSAVGYVLDHIARKDRQVAEGEAYSRRGAADLK